MKISTVIITKNEASNIARCLTSLTDVADEIIVVDAYSQDQTEAICRTFPTVKFVSRTWTSFAAAKNFGNDLATHDYILSVDADEVLSAELRDELCDLKPNLRVQTPLGWSRTAYEMPRLNHVGTSPIRYCGWYPDVKIRLFPKNAARWVGDFVHERLDFDGKVERLKSHLLHFTFRSTEQFECKLLYYAELTAQEEFLKRHRSSFVFMLLKAEFKFLNVYFFKLGFLDGQNGRLIANLLAKGIVWKYVALQRLQRKENLWTILGYRFAAFLSPPRALSRN